MGLATVVEAVAIGRHGGLRERPGAIGCPLKGVSSSISTAYGIDGEQYTDEPAIRAIEALQNRCLSRTGVAISRSGRSASSACRKFPGAALQ